MWAAASRQFAISLDMFYLITTPRWIRRFFPGCIWEIEETRPVVYLTFDDGPDSEVTPFVLDLLQYYEMRATFFCIGKNVEAHPEVYARILREGHRTGNHTHHHLNGWKTPDTDYLNDVERCREVLPSRLFRPPYGRMSRSQASVLRRNYKIVMWDVLSGDYSPDISPEKCLSNITENAGPGSIIVMHDSLKARKNLLFALPRVLEHYASAGFSFEVIRE